MDIRARVGRLLERMHDTPQYTTQGKVLFVDLEMRTHQSAYLPVEVVRNFLGGRGANMFLVYNLMDENLGPLDPQQPLVFGSGILSSNVPGATRGNVSGISPDSFAILDANVGDYFPSFMRRKGYDHLVFYGQASEWLLLKFEDDSIDFLSAAPYVGMDNLEMTEAVQQDFDCREQVDMAMARITTSGENQVLCSGIMAGEKAIYARGGAGAKMGSLKLKAILLLGKPQDFELSPEYGKYNKVIAKKILGTSVIRNALKKVGTPFLYKPSRVLGAMGTKNNQETTWVEDLDADNIDPYRPGMGGCYKCPVHCRARNDMLPGGKGGWGSHALQGLKGNASYDKKQADVAHEVLRTYNGARNDGQFDQYDKGEGPEYVTLGKFGPNIGITSAPHVLRLNNILNDLGLDSASTGGAIAWAMELYQRGIITQKETCGLDLSWGNNDAIEQLLFQTAKREGFGDVIADSGRAVENGKYPPEAADYRMTVKGLFQSDPHDARILKAFALGLAVATRGMDHLRNRVTLEINARVNDDAAFKTELYGGTVSPMPNSYEGKEYAVRRTEDTFAAGDSVGMCRFNTKLFNSPSLPDCGDFATQVTQMTGVTMSEEEVLQAGRNVMAIERMINARIGMRAKDDTLPKRWFEEPNTFGPFKGEFIDRGEFEKLKSRFYKVSQLNEEGVPELAWHEKLATVITGSAIKVNLPQDVPGAPEHAVIVDQPVTNVLELREYLARRLPEAREKLSDRSLSIAVNGEVVMVDEASAKISQGDEVTLLPMIGGGQ